METHLTWWQLNLVTSEGIKKFRDNCGNFSVKFKQIIRKYIKDKKYTSVLDCGAGLCTEYYGFLHDNYSIRYSAIDITPVLVDLGQSEGISIQLGSLENIPKETNSVDVCICLDVINHQFDFQGPIDEMLRVASKEVIISFHKVFMENNKVQRKGLNKDGAPTLIAKFFNKQDIIEYLNNENLDFRFVDRDKNCDRTILFISKGSKNES